MKFLFTWLYLFFSGATVFASDITNNAESWEAISNRWSTASVEIIQEAAKSDVTAQFYLAVAYSDGLGVSKDATESFKWMLLAAKQGMAKAERNVGFMYMEGKGTQMDDSEAAKYMRLAAEQNDARAENALGWLFKKGRGVPDDPREAVRWYQRAAEQGNTTAQINLAWMYAAGAYGEINTNGQGAQAQIKSGGIAPEHEKAEMWMKKAVDLNTAGGQRKYALLLQGEFDDNGFQDTTRSAETAEWFEKAARQGDARSQYELAEMYHTGKLGDDQRSNCIPWFLKSAAQGYAEAQKEVGELEQFYPGNELLKTVDPIDNLKRSAEQNDLQAQFDLAVRYHHGQGVLQDDKEAFKWMERAAQHDISPVTRTIDAHYYLGMMYENGEGVETNLAKACELYLAAAVGGNKPDPFTRVGEMYEKGEGVARDDARAADYYLQAIDFGYFPTSNDAARCQAIEGLLGLYAEQRGLPASRAEVEEQLKRFGQNQPVTTAKAQYLLGQIFHEGKIVSKNLAEAVVWYHLAAIQDKNDFQKIYDQAAEELSAPERTVADSQFEQLKQRADQAKMFNNASESYRLKHSW